MKVVKNLVKKTRRDFIFYFRKFIRGIGFLATLFLTTLFLNVYFLISRKTYKDIAPPKWQEQVTKIWGLSALSALAEEMFFRLFFHHIY